jgi:hypothetical protein
MLNILNRVIVSLVLVGLILILVAIAVTPEGFAAFVAFQLGNVHVAALSLDHLIIAVICLVVAALCTVVLRLQWRRGRARSIPLSGPGSTELATESVVARLKTDVEAVDLVRAAYPTVHGRGKVVDVILEVRTESHVDVPSKAEEVEGVVRDTIGRLGLQLGKTKVKIVVARDSLQTPVPPAS